MNLHRGRSLEDYPQTVALLQSLWSTPLSAMQALDDLLFRREAAEETFDFPAYRELLFLYSIAREISENVETDFGSIDLFLPLEDAPVESVARIAARSARGRPRRLAMAGRRGDERPARPAEAFRPPRRRLSRRREAQSAARRSIARASVSSFLPKQKRAIRCSKPSA